MKTAKIGPLERFPLYYGAYIVIFQRFDGCCSHWQWKDSGLPCSCSGAALQTQLHAKKWYVATLCTSMLHVHVPAFSLCHLEGYCDNCVSLEVAIAMCTSCMLAKTTPIVPPFL